MKVEKHHPRRMLELTAIQMIKRQVDDFTVGLHCANATLARYFEAENDQQKAEAIDGLIYYLYNLPFHARQIAELKEIHSRLMESFKHSEKNNQCSRQGVTFEDNSAQFMTPKGWRR